MVVAKYIYPGHKELKLKELGIREREAQNDADRIKANAMLAESQRQTNVLIDGMRASLDASTARVDVIVSEIHGSRDGSKRMGEEVARVREASDHIRQTTDHTAEQVADLHRRLMREGTD